MHGWEHAYRHAAPVRGAAGGRGAWCPGGRQDCPADPPSGRGCERPGDSPFVLVGLDAIGRAVGAGQGAVKRWIREDGFPARRCSDGTYRADPDAVRRWFWTGPTEEAGPMAGGKTRPGRERGPDREH